jgi:P pilus assembly chaperone PapD
LKKLDLKDMIKKIEITSSNGLELLLANHGGQSVRPFEVMENIFNLSGNQIKKIRVIKEGNRGPHVKETGH